MNLFRSEEHAKGWSLYHRAVDDYILPVAEWATVFSASLFRRRLDADYLARAPAYVDDYRNALRATGKTIPSPDRVLTTVLFTDIVESTNQAAALGDDAWRALLERHNSMVRAQLEHFAGREVKQTGDGFLAAFESPARAIRCAVAICEAAPGLGLAVRAGVHSGECEVLGNDLGGIGVHIGARVASAARGGEVLVSSTVKDAVSGSGIDFVDRGDHSLKGVPGRWQLYAPVP